MIVELWDALFDCFIAVSDWRAFAVWRAVYPDRSTETACLPMPVSKAAVLVLCQIPLPSHGDLQKPGYQKSGFAGCLFRWLAGQNDVYCLPG